MSRVHSLRQPHRLPLTLLFLIITVFLLDKIEGVYGLSSSSSALSNKKCLVVGAGPCGLFLSGLLLQQDPTVQIHLVDKSPSPMTSSSGAGGGKEFGFGISERAQRCLTALPGLKERILGVGAPVTGRPHLKIVQRSDLVGKTLSFLKENYKGRFRVDFETECTELDVRLRRVTLSSSSSSSQQKKNNKELSYDLIVGADGVNSFVRRCLVEEHGLKEQHYLHRTRWKALRLPQQDDLEPGTFRPLIHPSFGGAIIPRYPEGFTALIFWRGDGTRNPGGVEDDVNEFRQMLTEAIQRELPKASIIQRITWSFRKQQQQRRREEQQADAKQLNIAFDNDEVERFLHSSVGREHFMKCDRYHHDDSVALVGDAAHAMYSMLGQGYACGLESCLKLSQCLSQHSADDIQTALAAYSQVAVPEGHAITDLNLVGHSSHRNLIGQLLATPLMVFQAMRGKILVRRVNDDIPYSHVLRENRLLVAWSRIFWRLQRLPFHSANRKNG